MPEIRQDVIHGHWTIFSPDRARRPAQLRATAAEERWDNPFAPGQEASTPMETFALREAGTAPDGPGWRVRVVPNRYPAVFGEGLSVESRGGPHVWRSGIGHHEVVIETPHPAAEMEDRSVAEVAEWLGVLQQRIGALAQDPRIEFVQVFKNRGIMAGATLAHPHSQIIAMPMVPPATEQMLGRLRAYRGEAGGLWCDLLAEEQTAEVRMVGSAGRAMAFCPFAARVPFETWVVPREAGAHFHQASPDMVQDMAELLHRVLTGLAKAQGRPDYNILVHTAPVREPRMAKDWPGWADGCRWWVEVMPRLGRFAGFEMGTGMYINALWPEEAARHLREQAFSEAGMGGGAGA